MEQGLILSLLKVIDEDELMTTEHNTIFQVSDIVTATEHSDLKKDNADQGDGDNGNGDKKMMTNVDKLFKVGDAWKPSWTLLFHR